MRRFFAFSISVFCFAHFHSQSLNYYFGNLHAHTGFSDGNKDSLTSGISRPDGSYSYAKLSQNFDFLGISEHNHFSSANNPGFEIQNYPIGLNMANAANVDGTFLTLFGIEYGVSSNYNGHVVIYGFNQLIGWESGNYAIYNAKSDYDGLFTKVKNNPNAFCYLAHPYHTDFSSSGTFAGALAHAPYNAGYDSAIVGVPFRSGLAFSTFTNYSDYAASDYLDYFKSLLHIGYHIGMGYDHDNHYTNFGRSNGGRLVILAPSLTRANLTAAMQQMHFYGSDDSNAKIDFNMNGQVMGSILSGGTYPTFQVTHSDPDGENADTIKIWKGYANSGGLWADVVHSSYHSNTTLFTDTAITANTEYYYFAEIKQSDGQSSVTSPIWYTGLGALGIKENSEVLQFNFYPNPVNKKLNVSYSMHLKYDLLISDVSGRELLHVECHEQDCSIDLSDFKAGLYTLTVKAKNKSLSKKFVLE